jgi:glycosyltransferase involved in cell wall biosynthesis
LRLLLIGDGVMLPQVRDRIAAHGLHDRCTLTGMVPQPEGPAHLAACDILASPTIRNADGTDFFGSPTKLFEYLAMGKGVIASRLAQLAEIVEHDRTGLLVAPGDADELASAIERLADDAALRQRLGAAAREQVLAHHTWRGHTARIMRALRESFP